MSVLDETERKRYLKEMGITSWALSAPGTSTKTETAVEPVAAGADSPFTEQTAEMVSAPESVGPVATVTAFAGEVPVVPDETPALAVHPVSSAVPDTTESWEKLLDEIGCCERCHLCRTRNKVVPGVGDRQADWLFVGEGPGFHEDQQGEPFVGRSGKLLDSIMAAMRMKRGSNVYIANVVKCRASNEFGKDRQPTEEEAATCMPYLERQIELIRPRIMVALGKTAAVALLNTGRDVSLGSLRSKEHFFRVGGRRIPLIVTYHPSYLLRTPAGKKQAWQDLCRAMDIYDAEKKKEM